MIKVSVIIPVYNVESYLRDCIDSLVNQTLQDIEIICIDDGSTDGSLNILNEYASKDSRIVVVNNKENIGAGRSRNIGIHMAKGEYLSILDSDDFCDLRFLEIVYNNCIIKNADIGIYGFAKYDNVKKNIINISLPQYFLNRVCDNVFNFEQVKDRVFQMINWVPYNKMYKKKFVLDNKIEFQDLQNTNDAYFGCLILTQAERMIFIDTISPLYFYRVNVSTQISNNRHKNPRCTWEAILAIKKSLLEKRIFESCRKSFNSYAVTALIYSLNSIEGEFRKDLYDFLYYEGLVKLEIHNCNENDFISGYVYHQYKYLFMGHYNVINNTNTIYRDSSKNKTLFEYLNKAGYRCGLWGIGLLGKMFLNACNEHDFHLSCLIDEDISKTGMQIDEYIVKPFKSTCDMIDAVIITNTHYYKEILNIIRQSNRKIKLIDVDIYCRLGLEVEECIF